MDKEFVREFNSVGAAEGVKAMLKSEGVSSSLEIVEAMGGVPIRVRLVVASSQAHRARWILEDSGFSDGELNYLATGSLNPDGDDPSD